MPDLPAAEAAIRAFLQAMGADPDDPRLAGTATRVATTGAELFSGLGVDAAAVFATDVEAPTTSPVIVRGIPFRSMCEHHLLPFSGEAAIAYLPRERVAGLGALVRVVDTVASRPQVQERVADEVADAVFRGLDARGVFVRIEAEHACEWARGRQVRGASMLTVASRGEYDAGVSRMEALALLGTPARPQARADAAGDRIVLEGIRVRAFHGVHDVEREQGQTFVIDVELTVPLATAAATDDVTDTVHYGVLSDRIAAAVASDPVNLIETVAERVAALCLDDPRVSRAVVTVHKPEAPLRVEFGDVIVRVDRGR
ncbi:dihydroneopterin aldolase [Desertivibrio insolitus]|uniref:dihydroneopterin aldolase n=1 Tax=Herbiconiux sp. SYSU D00978 TaxID=2812562 RepID=UPI001A975524|nr:dihydroneopterin aldolase [Herbiconiux sp. SYSU D00978]